MGKRREGEGLHEGKFMSCSLATHSSILAWRIPGTEEPGGLLSMGSHRVGHDWSDLAAAAAWADGRKAESSFCVFCFLNAFSSKSSYVPVVYLGGGVDIFWSFSLPCRIIIHICCSFSPLVKQSRYSPLVFALIFRSSLCQVVCLPPVSSKRAHGNYVLWVISCPKLFPTFCIFILTGCEVLR